MMRRRSSAVARRASANQSSFADPGSAPSRVAGAPACRFIAKGTQVLIAVAAVMIGTESNVLACPVCFGAEETALIDGTKLLMLVMLGVTFAVQGGFVGFFLYLRKRAKRNADVELDLEWLELQRGSRTS